MTERFDPAMLQDRLRSGETASAVAYFLAHGTEIAILCHQALDLAEVVEQIRVELAVCHAHRFDLDYGPHKAAELLDRLGIDEEPRGGPDNFYNGAEFVGKRIAAVLRGAA